MQEPTPPYTRVPCPFPFWQALRGSYRLTFANIGTLLFRSVVAFGCFCALYALLDELMGRYAPTIQPIALSIYETLGVILIVPLVLDCARAGMRLPIRGTPREGGWYPARFLSPATWQLTGYTIGVQVLAFGVGFIAAFPVGLLGLPFGAYVVAIVVTTVFTFLLFMVQLLLAPAIGNADAHPVRSATTILRANLLRLPLLVLLLMVVPLTIATLGVWPLFAQDAATSWKGTRALFALVSVLVGIVFLLPLLVMPGVVYRHSVGVPDNAPDNAPDVVSADAAPSQAAPSQAAPSQAETS